MKKTILSLSTLLLSSQVFASTAEICADVARKVATKQQVVQACSEAVAKNMGIVQAQTNAIYDGLQAKLEECKANHGDCANYKIRTTKTDEKGNKTVSYQKINLEDTQKNRKKMEKEIIEASKLANKQCQDTVRNKGEKECQGQFEGPQAVADTLVNLSTLFISSIIPGKTLHVDVGDILAGKPLGGDSSVLVEIREALLDVSLAPDIVQDYIRDPIHVSENIVTDIIKGSTDIMNQICGDLCRGFDVSF